MKILYCTKCGKIVIKIKKGEVKKGTIIYCRECGKHRQNQDSGIFDMFKNTIFKEEE